MSWCSLATHSQYSVLQSTMSVKQLVARAAAYGMTSLALTDSGNLYGAVDFYKAAKAEGIKPIIGAQLYLSFADRRQKSRTPDRPNYSSIIVLAKNAKGYKNLCKLSSAGYLEGFYYVPRVDKAMLLDCSEGLICLSGCVGSYHGYFATHRPQSELEKECADFETAFGSDFYLQLQRLDMQESDLEADGMHDEPWLIQKYQEFIQDSHRSQSRLHEVSRKMSVPLVATHESYYLERPDWRAHEILLNIQSGEPCEIWQRDSDGNPIMRSKNPKREVLPSHEYYFKSPQQIAQLFHDYPDAVAQSAAIAAKCEFQIDFKGKHYPSFVPPGSEHLAKNPEALARAVADHLPKVCQEALKARYTPARLEAIRKVEQRDPELIVAERLAMELDIIISKGLADYLLIVADFIQWAKSRGIPMGPGRGSGAGSIVCYLLGITDIEPLRFHLFFERFINPERISYPDIDVDICMDRRCEVIDYMLKKYGRENVAQIITFGTMKAKMSLKDVGRVLSFPLSKVNHICKILPDDLNLTLEDALKDPELQQLVNSDESTRELFTMAQILEGSIRNTGIHAAGLIICADSLVEHIPLCSSKDAEMPVTQYSMKPVEAVGMLKIDFLGLKTLTSIKKCVEEIRRRHGIEVNWFELSLEDKATFDLLNKGKTLGVFQLESGGMQDLARQLHLDCFEEIIAVVSLYRPGPMDMIPSFINRKHKREPIEYDHPWLSDILSETYGIMVYQEQVMQIASRLAGFTLAEGDVLRRAMGKKDAEEMGRQRVMFLEGAKSKGIDDQVASSIFDKMEKFAAYGFNKSHAAAYGYIAYVTAYMKANYPKEWMAALMTCDSHDLSKVSKFIAEAHAMDISILAPDVNESGAEFRAAEKGIRFSLSAIKGVGSAVVEHIEQRRQAGPYSDLRDFLKRIDLKRVGKKSLELLIDAGALDFTTWTRDELRQSLDLLFSQISSEQQDAEKGVMTLFNLFEVSELPLVKPKVTTSRTPLELLLKEKELLGFFLTGSPMQVYQGALRQLSCVPLTCVNDMQTGGVIRTAFVIDELAVKVAQKSQKKFAILKICDGHERFELPVWSEQYEKYAHLLVENRVLAAVLIVERQDDSVKLSCRWIVDLSQVTPSDTQACDEAYDKAKSQAAYPRRPPATTSQGAPLQGPPSPAKESKKNMSAPSSPRQLHLVLDVMKLRFSHILLLKETIGKHLGKDSLRLVFSGSNKKERQLVLDGRLNVNWNRELEEQLMKLIPLIEVKEGAAT